GAALALVLGGAACGSAAAPGPDPFAAPSACSSGATRDVNESEGPEMMPGRACNACHAAVNASTGEAAPVFRFAGTLYPSGHEPDDCIGSSAEGAEVLVTDAAGVTFSAVANAAGNFMLDGVQTFVAPFSVRVRFQQRERPMLSWQTDGDCNGCHTRD